MSGAELALAQPWSKGLQAGDGRRVVAAWCLALQRMFIEQGVLVVHFCNSFRHPEVASYLVSRIRRFSFLHVGLCEHVTF